MNNSFIYRLAIALLLPFMLLVVSPLSFYLGNINEVSFSLKDVALHVTMLFFGISILIFIILSLLKRFLVVLNIAAGSIVGLSASSWIQCQLFIWNFGQLDGRKIDWNHWTTHMWIEGIVWLLVITVMIILYYFGKERFKKTVLQGLFILGLISSMGSYLSAPTKVGKMADGKDIEELFSFHPENNIIVILLDCFQSDYFEYIANNYPEDVRSFEGFTFYRNTISQFPTTRASKPAIMTNAVYKNEKPINEFTLESYKKSSLGKIYKNKFYSFYSVGAPEPGTTDTVTMNYVLNSFNWNDVPPYYEFIDYGMFRSLPTSLKKYIYNDGNWLLAFKGLKGYPPTIHGNDIRFLELFESRAKVDVSSKKTFKFIHFNIPHNPLRLNENLQYDSTLSGVEGYIKQCRGALKIANRIIRKLKSLDIYDNTEIVIMSDHGSKDMPTIMDGEDTPVGALSEIPMKVRSSSLAVLLHKKPHVKGKLITSDIPLMLTDLICILGEADAQNNCSNFKTAIEGRRRERTYLYYDWSNDYWDWKSKYMPPIVEYRVTGHAYENKSWQLGNYIYTKDGILNIKAHNYNYTVGKQLRVSAMGESDSYFLGGWRYQEAYHRWTNSPKAGLRFLLKETPSQNLELRLQGNGYLAKGKIDYQKINVEVNGQRVAQWHMRNDDWYTAIIPAHLVSNCKIDILFDISKHTNKNTLSSLAENSKEAWKLGMAVRGLVIDYAKGGYNPNTRILV